MSGAGTPQAALVGVVVSDAFEIFFDTLEVTRKAANLRARPHAALVLGRVDADAQVTIQVEGVADEPGGAELARLKALYFERFVDGRPDKSRYRRYRIRQVEGAREGSDADGASGAAATEPAGAGGMMSAAEPRG